MASLLNMFQVVDAPAITRRSVSFYVFQDLCDGNIEDLRNMAASLSEGQAFVPRPTGFCWTDFSDATREATAREGGDVRGPQPENLDSIFRALMGARKDTGLVPRWITSPNGDRTSGTFSLVKYQPKDKAAKAAKAAEAAE